MHNYFDRPIIHSRKIRDYLPLVTTENGTAYLNVHMVGNRLKETPQGGYLVFYTTGLRERGTILAEGTDLMHFFLELT